MTDKRILSSRGIQLYHFDTVDSTNRVARTHAAESGHVPALFLADAQTQGRGRLGRSFFSPAQTGIYMTLLMDVTDEDVSSVAKLTSAAAVAVTDVMDKHMGVDGQIKWVNDIYVNGKKVCGILAESFFCDDRRYVAVGVGINLNTHVFPSELEDVAGSVGVSTNKQERVAIAELMGAALWDIFGSLRDKDSSFMDRYRKRSMVIGKQVTFTESGVTREGFAVAVDDCGGLVVSLADGSHTTLCSGEITLRLR